MGSPPSSFFFFFFFQENFNNTYTLNDNVEKKKKKFLNFCRDFQGGAAAPLDEPPLARGVKQVIASFQKVFSRTNIDINNSYTLDKNIKYALVVKGAVSPVMKTENMKHEKKTALPTETFLNY